MMIKIKNYKNLKKLLLCLNHRYIFGGGKIFTVLKASLYI